MESGHSSEATSQSRVLDAGNPELKTLNPTSHLDRRSVARSSPHSMWLLLASKEFTYPAKPLRLLVVGHLEQAGPCGPDKVGLGLTVLIQIALSRKMVHWVLLSDFNQLCDGCHPTCLIVSFARSSPVMYSAPCWAFGPPSRAVLGHSVSGFG